MFLDPTKIAYIPTSKLSYSENLPRQNVNIETLVKLANSNIPNDLPLISTTYTEKATKEEQISILLSNLLLKIRKLQNQKKVAVAFYHKLTTQELLFIYTTYKKYNLINYLEEAIILHQLNKEGFTHKQIANVLGVSRSYITNKIRFIAQPKELIEAVINNEITEGHAKLLMGIKDKVTKLNILEIIKTENLSVKETGKLIQNFRGIKPTASTIKSSTKKLLNQLEKHISNITKDFEITIPKRRKTYLCKITLKLQDQNQLEKLTELLKQ